MQLLKNNSLIYLLTGLIFLIGHPMTLPAEEPASTFNGLDVYITRHAETMGNVTGHYSEENQCTFSEKGKQQIAALPEKLNGYDFDLILVSPTYRTQHTILPYLMANNRTGLIFQAIEEIDCDAGPVQPSAEITQGKPVEIIPEGKKHLQLFDPAFTRRYDPENPAQVAAQIQGARDWILAHYGNSGKTLLLVCHSCTGSRLLEAFLGLSAQRRFAPANTGVSHLQQRPDGQFDLLLYNDEPRTANFQWRMGKPGKFYRPGETMPVELFPELFAPLPRNDYHLKCTIKDPAGDVIQSIDKRFFPEQREGVIYTVNLPLKEADFGDQWQLDAQLFIDDRPAGQWQETVFIPTCLALDGAWRIHAGDDPAWAHPALDDHAWKRTAVPGGWEKDALPEYDGIAWYRKHFDISPAELHRWADADIGVALGAVDDADELYLNGKLIGKTGAFPPDKETAWNVPRIYSIDRALLRGSNNVIAVRVSDWMGGGGIWRYPVAIGPVPELHILTADSH
jgi:broad specificity phosphatase PhoE